MSEPSYDRVYQLVEESSCPFVTTADVAEEFDSVSDRTIRKRLNDLVRQGKLERRQVGAHAKVWYIGGQSRDSARTSSPSSLNQ